MTVDVSTSIVINRPRKLVSRYSANPDHAPEWYVNTKAIEWQTTPPVTIGSRISFVAHFSADEWPTPTRSSTWCRASAC